MKKLIQKLFILSCTVLSLQATAQPTLTHASNSPVVGDKFDMRNSNYVSPGSAGASQTWNLSAMSTTAAIINYTAVTVASTPSASSYPLANVSLKDPSTYIYYNTSASAWLNYGAIASGIVFSYSNPETYLNYPFNYTNSFADFWSCTYVSSSLTFYRYGTSSVTADGWGTVTTPAGTFNNVMRVHLVQVYKDSSAIFPIINYVNDQYLWYRPNTHYPIASVFSFTTGTSVSTGGSYLNNVLTGVTENSSSDKSVNVFPNPASQYLNLDCNLEPTHSTELFICNSMGQIVKHFSKTETIIGENKFRLDISDLASGIYYLQINSDGILEMRERFVIAN